MTRRSAIELKGLKSEGADKDLVRKDVVGIDIKDAEKGEVEAIIATLGVVDKDFDVIATDAIPDGSKVKVSSYGHDVMWGEQPVGKGALHLDGNKVVFRGKLFLATQGGRETFEVLKEMGKEQEWSFGFRVNGSEVPDEGWKKKGAQRILTKLDCFEVSPVLQGAGVGTRTVAVKEEKPPVPPAPEPAPPEPGPAPEPSPAPPTPDPAEKAVADRADAEMKACAREAVDEFHRVQRTLKRMRLI